MTNYIFSLDITKTNSQSEEHYEARQYFPWALIALQLARPMNFQYQYLLLSDQPEFKFIRLRCQFAVKEHKIWTLKMQSIFFLIEHPFFYLKWALNQEAYDTFYVVGADSWFDFWA